MKKFFTLLACTALAAGSLFAQEAPSQSLTVGLFQGETHYKGFNSELTLDQNGNYVLSNFMGSGHAMTFTFDPAEIETDGYALPEIVALEGIQDLYIWAGFYTAEDVAQWGEGYDDYIGTPYYGVDMYNETEDVYIDFTLQPKTSPKKTNSIYNSIVLIDYGYVYSAIEPSTEEGYDYDATFNVTGYDAADETFETYTDVYAYFYFNAMESSAVGSISSDDNNSPVEYYNLQGVRVSDPQGLVIRRQGAKAQKIIVR